MSYSGSAVFVCACGHMTECYMDPDSGDWRAGYHNNCRRVQPVGVANDRCGLPVIRTSTVPALEAAFRVGGEPAVVDLIGALGWANIVETKALISNS